MVVDLVLSSKGPPSVDTVTKEDEDDTVQILFINTESNEHGGNLPVPLPQAGRKFVRDLHGRLFSPSSKQLSRFLRLESTR